MPQFLIPPGGKPGDLIRLSPEESRHLRDILRVERGEKIRVTDGEGNRFAAAVHAVSKKEVAVLIGEKLPAEVQNGILKIGQALLKRERMEWVIQKAAELGVHSLYPFSSSRTVAILKRAEKLARWQKIADEAVKQCGRGSRMNVQNTAPFDDLIRETADLKIIFWEEEGEPVRKFAGSGFKLTQTTLVLVGPEGGFSREEVVKAREAGFAVLSLGQRILRAETAAIVAMSLIQYELDNL